MAEAIGLKAILDDKEFQAGATRYTKSVQNMESLTSRAARGLTSSFGAIGGAFSAVGQAAAIGLTAGVATATAALGALSAAAYKGIGELNQWAGQIDALGDQFGMTGEQASGFSFLANKVGLDVSEMGMGLNTFTRGLDQMAADLKAGKKEQSEFTKALQQLGVKATDSKGKLRTFDALLPEMMDKFKKLPPGINASALAMQLFGARGGSKFLDFLRQGSDGLEDARKKAKELGLEISSEESDAVEEFGFAMNELKLALKGAWVTVGRAALPIVRSFVDVINRNMPKVVSIVKQLADRFKKDVYPALSQFASWALRTGIPVLQAFADRLGNLFSAFQKGGLSGFFDELGRQLSGAFKGFDASQILGNLVSALSTAWNQISPELSKWGTRFWNWLTGPGGALEQAGAQLGKVVGAIAKWVGTASNIDPIVNTMKSWITQFWWWLTDPTSGAIAVVFTEMAKLAERLEKWVTDEATIQRIQDVGAAVARTIIEGIGKFFESDSRYSQDAFTKLAGALDRARRATNGAFASIASALASGFIGEIAKFFAGEEAANRIKDGLYTALTSGIKKLLEGGSLLNAVMNLGIEIGKSIIAGLMAGLTGGGGSTIPPSPGPNYYWDPNQKKWVWKGKTYASGGFVPRTAPALLHAGEYVLNRQQVRAMMPMLASAPVTTNHYSFSHVWNGGTGGMSRTEIETVVRRATFESMTQVLGKV